MDELQIGVERRDKGLPYQVNKRRLLLANKKVTKFNPIPGYQKQFREGVEECTSNIKQVTEISEEKSKEISYYTGLTHKKEELDFIPVLSLQAGSGSGKNEVQKVIMKYSLNPRWITMGEEVTRAMLKEYLNSLDTAIIEEADTVPEDILRRRPYKVSGPLGVFKPVIVGKQVAYSPIEYNLFGATILHRRLEFRDNAVRRRALIVRWRHYDTKEIEEMGLIFKPAKELTYAKSMDMVKNVPLPDISPFTSCLKNIGNLTLDLWQPVLQMATIANDISWINNYAIQAMIEESEEIESTMNVEPGALVFRVLLSILEGYRNPGIPDKLRPVSTVDIGKKLYSDHRRSMAEKQISGLLKSAGMQMKCSGGYTKVYPTRETLKKAARVFTVRDEMIDNIDSWQEWEYGKKKKL